MLNTECFEQLALCLLLQQRAYTQNVSSIIQLSVDKISLTHYTNTGPDWFLQGLAFIGRFQIDPDHKCTCTLQTYLKRLTQLNTTKGPVTFCLSATRLSTEVNWMKIN